MKGLLLAGLLCAVNTAYAQSSAKLSPQTRIYLKEMATHPQETPRGYVWIKDAAGKLLVKAFIQVEGSKSSAVGDKLTSVGVLIGTKAGNIWTAAIPKDKIAAVASISGIHYLQLDEPVFPDMDSARKATRVDSVQSGYNLPMAYTGKDVIVGIIDAGFDYRHPTLFDTTGSGYRVRRVWEQKNASGTPPSGFSYGNEITDSNAMWAQGHDAFISHGSHVAGIAAGSGYGSDTGNRRFRGMAYGSDLVFVGITPAAEQWLGTGMTDIIDGLNYIYNYAAGVGKPAIANLSWGCSMGPHDGSSMFSQACDALTGPGKLFAVSAGNNGDEAIHIKKQFTTSDTTLNTFVTFDPYLGAKRAWVDIWGDTAKSFCAAITLYQGNNAGTATGFICLDDALHQEYLIGSDNDTLFISIGTEQSSFNNKPRILMQFYSKTVDAINLTVKATDGVVQAWNGLVDNTTGYYGPFVNANMPWAQNGDAASTIGDMAATRSAISVAAYASKNRFTNLAGAQVSYTAYVTKGNRVPFSSHGPMANNAYMKPDITGPGMTLGSAVNSYDPTMIPGGTSADALVAHHLSPVDNRDYYYGQLSGTSMSSPAVAGILALMLQAEPSLSPDAARQILRATAIKDVYTTPNPDSNLWGAGKVNAYHAVMKAAGVTRVASVRKQNLNFTLYPNPAQKQFSVMSHEAAGAQVQLTLMDAAGTIVWTDSWTVSGSTDRRDITTSLAPGTYLVMLKTGDKEGSRKLELY